MPGVQNLRKESNFDVTDKINLTIQRHLAINDAIEKHASYIGSQTLAVNVKLVDKCDENASKLVEIDEEIVTYIAIEKA